MEAVQIHLNDKEKLWNRFHGVQNEMIVTKTGRKIFPKLEFTISGLEPESLYGVVIQMEQVDDNRYKFADAEWTPAGRGEQTLISNPVCHHDGVMTGAQWMRSPVHFERLKITNNQSDTNPSHIFLHSMHKYIPVISIFKVDQGQTGAAFLNPTQSTHQVALVKFTETNFITVTAYQNDKLKALKIKYNPYAKGFREGGDRKKSPSSPPSCHTPTNVKLSELSPPSMMPMSPLNSTLSPMNFPLYNPAIWNPYLFMNPYRLAALQQSNTKPFTM